MGAMAGLERLRTNQAYFRGDAIAVESSRQRSKNPQKLAPGWPTLQRVSTGAQGVLWPYGHGGRH